MNSIHVIYGILQECNNHALTEEVSSFYLQAFIKSFACCILPILKIPRDSLPHLTKDTLVLPNASMELSEANAACLISRRSCRGIWSRLKKKKLPIYLPSPLQKNILLLQLPYLI